MRYGIVGLVVLALAFAAPATAAPVPPEQEGEAILERDARIATLTREVVELRAEVARLKALCRAAGMDPDAGTGKQTESAAKPKPQEMPPAVKAYAQRLAHDRARRLKLSEVPSAFMSGTLVLGAIGQFEFHGTVVSVMGPQDMLVKVEMHYGTWGKPEGGPLHTPTVWITGYPTLGLTDDAVVALKGRPFEVTRTRHYNTAGGSMRTIFELRAFDGTPYGIK